MNESPHLLTRLANALFVSDAPDVVPSYEHSWPWSAGAAVLLVLVSTAIVLYFYFRERNASKLVKGGLASLRIVLILLAMIMLYGWMLRRHRVDLPDLALIVDVSSSMQAADRYQNEEDRRRIAALVKRVQLTEPTRINVAKAVLLGGNRPLLEQLQRRYNLKLYFADASPRQQSGPDLGENLRGVAAKGDQSRHGDVLRNVLELQRGRPTAAAILITDGITTEGQSLAEAAEYARRKSTPLFAVGVGDENAPRDVRIGDLLVDEVVFVGDLINFDFKLTASGYRDKRVTLRLKKRGRPDVLAEKSVVLGEDGQTRSVRLSHREEEVGEHSFVIEAEPLADESNPDNNRLERKVSVREETIRVLLVQEYPSYEFRDLKMMLGRALKQNSPTEKAFQLTVVLQEADLRWAELDEVAQRVFPVSRDELFKFDVILFGDVDRAHLSAATLRNLSDFVRERGGGIVFIAGPRHTPLAYRDTPLASLFPIDLATAAAPPQEATLNADAEFRPAPTRLGLTSPQFQLGASVAENVRVWREMPPLLWTIDAPDLRPGARVLLEHPTRTTTRGEPQGVVSMQFAGAGKVIFHSTDESYRWARHPDGRKFYERYWLQTIRFLSRSKLLGGSRGAELSSDRREYRRGDPVRMRLRFLDDRLAPAEDDGVVIVIERSGGKRQQVRLTRSSTARGVFEATVSNLPDGDYRAWLATPTLTGAPPSQNFTITAPLGEQARLQMDAAELSQAAKLTGGRFYRALEADALLEDLPDGRKVRIESMPPEPIWNSSFLAGLFVVIIVSEWLLRKRVGML